MARRSSACGTRATAEGYAKGKRAHPRARLSVNSEPALTGLCHGQCRRNFPHLCRGNAVKITADADHALMGDTPFQLEHRAEGRERQRFEVRLLLGEDLVDNALRGGVHTRIGKSYRANAAIGRSGHPDSETSGRGRSPRGYTDTGARPSPWFWLGMGDRPSAGMHDAGREAASELSPSRAVCLGWLLDNMHLLDANKLYVLKEVVSVLLGTEINQRDQDESARKSTELGVDSTDES